MKPVYVFFDLDHTLLNGDTDVLWIEFLAREGLVDGPTLLKKNQEISYLYKTGAVDPQEFTAFYVGTLTHKTYEQWQTLRKKFFQENLLPCFSEKAIELVNSHRSQGHHLILTSATNTFLTELSAQFLKIDTLLGSIPECINGDFTGKTIGTLNLKEGKVVNLKKWLLEQNLQLHQITSYAYSDSINDLPLLECVNFPVAVHPDERLQLIAKERNWPVVELYDLPTIG